MYEKVKMVNLSSTNSIQGATEYTFNVLKEKDENALKLQTLLTQEMLKKGFLTGAALYLSTAHDEKIMNEYFEKLNDTFHFISKSLQNDNLDQVLEGPTKKSSFSRLN